MVHYLDICTFTCDSVSSVTVRAASTPEGTGNSGLTGNTWEAGRVSTGHILRCWPPSDPRGEVGIQRHSGCSLILRRCCGLSVSGWNSPDTGDGGVWSRPPVSRSSGGGGRWWRGRSGSQVPAGIWFEDVNMTICSAGDCPLTCKTLEVRGYDLKY